MHMLGEGQDAAPFDIHEACVHLGLKGCCCLMHTLDASRSFPATMFMLHMPLPAGGVIKHQAECRIEDNHSLHRVTWNGRRS